MIWCVLLGALIGWVLVPAGDQPGRLRPPTQDGARARLRWLWAGRIGALGGRTRTLAGGGVGCVVAILLADFGLVGLVAGAAVGVGVAVGLGWLEPGTGRRRREQIVADLPQALDLLAACLTAGMPIRLAVREVVRAVDGPLAEDLSVVLARVDVGESDADAWYALRTHPVVGPMARDIGRSVSSGTGLADVLERHAADARREHAAAVQVRAKAVGVRSVLPLMACFLPAFVLVGVVPIVASVIVRLLG